MPKPDVLGAPALRHPKSKNKIKIKGKIKGKIKFQFQFKFKNPWWALRWNPTLAQKDAQGWGTHRQEWGTHRRKKPP